MLVYSRIRYDTPTIIMYIQTLHNRFRQNGLRYYGTSLIMWENGTKNRNIVHY